MKKIKVFLTTVLLLIPILFTMETMSLAVADNSGPYLMMYKKSNSRKSIALNKQNTDYYAINTAEDMTFGRPAIKLVRASDSSGSSQKEDSYNEAIYCIKGGQGFGSGSTNQVVKYEQKFNMRNPSEITSTYDKWNITSSSSNYPKIMWVLDNLCIPSDNDSRSALLTKAGVSFAGTGFSEDKINDIIESVQQAAIWYFTNPSDEFRPVEPNSFTLQVGSVSNHVQVFEDDTSGMDPAKKLYKYFIDNGKNQDSYNYESAGTKPLTYAKGFTTQTAPTTTISSDGTKYIIGPYLINKDSSKSYDTFTATITDGTNTLTDAKIVNASGAELSGSDISEKIAGSFGTEFYISVPIASVTSSVKLDVSSKYSVRTITYWWASNTSQPVAIIEPTTDNNNGTSTVTPTPPTFDLALRKFITKVTNSSGTTKTIANIERTPDVDESSLTSETTAKYKHRKDPVTVETGDVVTYKLRIYNEGETIGRPLEIIDQLPTGLTFNKIVSGSFTGKVTEATNTLTLTRNSSNTTDLPAYTTNSLIDGTGYEDIEIECNVTATPDTTNKKVLTNIAWISKEYNASTKETIINDLKKDRDSVPNTHPTAEKDNMSNYTGNENKDDLSDSSYYYKGQEDDDDFEKLLIEPVQKELDLALRKWISTIIPADGSATRTNVRTVTVNEAPLKNETGTTETTAEYKHSKNEITVETNDLIDYNLRIYNEGKVVGRATEITDQLPEGLEFVEVRSGNFEKDSYDTNKNILVLKRKADNTTNLPAYTEGSLQESGNGHETIVVRCKVNATYGSSSGKVLTNIAWISKQVIENGQEISKDLDSEPGKAPSVDKNSNDYKGTTSETDLSKQIYYPGQEDDDDFEKIIIRHTVYDLALRKFVTKIVDKNGTERQIDSREPKLEISGGHAAWGIDNGTTSNKIHSKQPLQVSRGDIVTYTIRVYNEGNVDGKATEITDYLPEGLEFIEPGTGNGQSKINLDNGWTATEKVVKTTKLADKTIHPVDYNPNNDETGLFNIPRYENIQIECRVVATKVNGFNLRNIAAITGDDGDDIDSNPSENPKNDSSYPTSSTPQGKGEQDDDDYEDLKLVKFDLALRKFITGVNNEKIKNRVPTVDTSKYGTVVNGKEVTTFTYTHTKEPIKVEQNDTVIYTIRVYNEGTADGYADLIKDDIPEGLEFLPEHEINKNTYKWKMLDESGNATTDVSKAKYITTDYLAKQGQSTENLLKAYTSNMEEPDHKDVKVAFKVTEPNTSDRIITNQAQISKHSDKDGNDITDIDSTPDKWNEGEDDQDVEHIYVKYFDLALRKWVTHAIVIEDGEQKEMETGHKAEDDPESIVKVELNKQRLENTVVKFRYSIRITNEGEIAGYATEISDYIPTGLRFNQADNPKWKEVDGKIVTDQLKDTLLQPGQSTTIDVLLTWINDEKNMGVMVNVAEISEDKNDSNTPDIDSTPNNQKEGEDDIDDAPVALTVVTGSAPTYIAIATGVIAIIGASVFFIKKYVV